MEHNMLELKIVTPNRLLFNTTCSNIIIPSIFGEMQILKGHTPFLGILKPGIITFNCPDKKRKNIKFMIEEGFIKINEKKVIILVESVTLPSEVNTSKEKIYIDSIKKKLSNSKLNKTNKTKNLEMELKKSSLKLQLLK